MRRFNGAFIPAVTLPVAASVLVSQTQGYAAMKSEGALKTELVETTYKATLKEGFHFNEKAPNQIVIDDRTIKPSELKAREALFSNLPKDFKSGRASFYICDDAVTYCEPHFLILKAGQAEAGAVPQQSSQTQRSQTYGKIDRHGFIDGDLSKALAHAKEKKQLVLVDFSARWCPGCVRYETETFGTKTWKDLTKNFVRVKIDTDRVENFALSEKFKIVGIPTLLVMDASQHEIDRLYDFQPNDVLTSYFKSIASDPTPLNELMKSFESKDQNVLLRAGRRLLASGRYEESVRFLEKVQPRPPEYHTAKIKFQRSQFQTDQKKKDGYKQALLQAIKAEPRSSRSIGWREELVSLIDEESEVKRLREEGVGVANQLLASPENLKEGIKTEPMGEFTGYERLWVAMLKASLVEASKADSNAVKQAWSEAAEVGAKLKIDPKKTGPNMRYIIVLTKAEKFQEADGLAIQMLKNDPENAEIKRRRLRVLLGQSKFKEATSLGEEVIKKSYGQNEVWVAEALAKAYIGANMKKEALTLINTYLNRDELEWLKLKESRQALEALKVTAQR